MFVCVCVCVHVCACSGCDVCVGTCFVYQWSSHLLHTSPQLPQSCCSAGSTGVSKMQVYSNIAGPHQNRSSEVSGVCACMRTCMHVCVHVCMRTCERTFIHM